MVTKSLLFLCLIMAASFASFRDCVNRVRFWQMHTSCSLSGSRRIFPQIRPTPCIQPIPRGSTTWLLKSWNLKVHTYSEGVSNGMRIFEIERLGYPFETGW
jgi:hypothetical protein